jgi:hypothetical protein
LTSPTRTPPTAKIAWMPRPTPYRFVLDQPVVAPPGDVWEYNSEATELVAAVVKKAVGKQVDYFFARAVSAVLS